MAKRQLTVTRGALPYNSSKRVQQLPLNRFYETERAQHTHLSKPQEESHGESCVRISGGSRSRSTTIDAFFGGGDLSARKAEGEIHTSQLPTFDQSLHWGDVECVKLGPGTAACWKRKWTQSIKEWPEDPVPVDEGARRASEKEEVAVVHEELEGLEKSVSKRKSKKHQPSKKSSNNNVQESGPEQALSTVAHSHERKQNSRDDPCGEGYEPCPEPESTKIVQSVPVAEGHEWDSEDDFLFPRGGTKRKHVYKSVVPDSESDGTGDDDHPCNKQHYYRLRRDVGRSSPTIHSGLEYKNCATEPRVMECKMALEVEETGLRSPDREEGKNSFEASSGTAARIICDKLSAVICQQQETMLEIIGGPNQVSQLKGPALYCPEQVLPKPRENIQLDEQHATSLACQPPLLEPKYEDAHEGHLEGMGVSEPLVEGASLPGGGSDEGVAAVQITPENDDLPPNHEHQNGLPVTSKTSLAELHTRISDPSCAPQQLPYSLSPKQGVVPDAILVPKEEPCAIPHPSEAGGPARGLHGFVVEPPSFSLGLELGTIEIPSFSLGLDDEEFAGHPFQGEERDNGSSVTNCKSEVASPPPGGQAEKRRTGAICPPCHNLSTSKDGPDAKGTTSACHRRLGGDLPVVFPREGVPWSAAIKREDKLPFEFGNEEPLKCALRAEHALERTDWKQSTPAGGSLSRGLHPQSRLLQTLTAPRVSAQKDTVAPLSSLLRTIRENSVARAEGEAVQPHSHDCLILDGPPGPDPRGRLPTGGSCSKLDQLGGFATPISSGQGLKAGPRGNGMPTVHKESTASLPASAPAPRSHSQHTASGGALGQGAHAQHDPDDMPEGFNLFTPFAPFAQHKGAKTAHTQDDWPECRVPPGVKCKKECSADCEVKVESDDDLGPEQRSNQGPVQTKLSKAKGLLSSGLMSDRKQSSTVGTFQSRFPLDKASDESNAVPGSSDVDALWAERLNHSRRNISSSSCNFQETSQEKQRGEGGHANSRDGLMSSCMSAKGSSYWAINEPFPERGIGGAESVQKQTVSWSAHRVGSRRDAEVLDEGASMHRETRHQAAREVDECEDEEAMTWNWNGFVDDDLLETSPPRKKPKRLRQVGDKVKKELTGRLRQAGSSLREISTLSEGGASEDDDIEEISSQEPSKTLGQRRSHSSATSIRDFMDMSRPRSPPGNKPLRGTGGTGGNFAQLSRDKQPLKKAQQGGSKRGRLDGALDGFKVERDLQEPSQKPASPGPAGEGGWRSVRANGANKDSMPAGSYQAARRGTGETVYMDPRGDLEEEDSGWRFAAKGRAPRGRPRGRGAQGNAATVSHGKARRAGSRGYWAHENGVKVYFTKEGNVLRGSPAYLRYLKDSKSNRGGGKKSRRVSKQK